MSAPAICAVLRESATAFREYPIYTFDGDPVILTVQADELDRAADVIEALHAALLDLSSAAMILDFKSEASMAALGRMIPIASAALAKARSEQVSA